MSNERTDMYHVGQYTKEGKRLATVSGLGRNRNTWDANHSKRTAKHYAKGLNASDTAHVYKAEHIYDWEQI